MLAGGASVGQVALLLAVKFAVAVIGGYLLKYTVFRSHKPASDEPVEVEMTACDCSAGSPVWSVVWHTIKTSFFLFAVMLVLDMVVHLIGEDVLASLLLSDTLFQPVLCAILGLVPSCAMSVLLSELFLRGTISFGALIAGLSTGAGFGYIVLFQEKEGRRRAFPVIAATFVVAVVGGMLVQRLTAEPNGLPFWGGRFFIPSSCSSSSASRPRPYRCVRSRRPACTGSFSRPHSGAGRPRPA